MRAPSAKSRLGLVLFGLGSVASAACTTQAVGPIPTAPVCRPRAACAVLTASDVTAATGTAFGDGTEAMSADPSVPTATRALCTYATGKAGDPVVSVLVRCCACGDNNPGEIAQAFGGDSTTVTDVSGVGDSAFWVATVPDAGLPMIDQLIVFVGADLQVVVTVSVPLGRTFAFDPLAAARKMAAAAVSNL
jgi:hypothetical protein